MSRWERLYEITLNIKKLQLWVRLKSTDLITVENPANNGMFYLIMALLADVSTGLLVNFMCLRRKK